MSGGRVCKTQVISENGRESCWKPLVFHLRSPGCWQQQSGVEEGGDGFSIKCFKYGFSLAFVLS